MVNDGDGSSVNAGSINNVGSTEAGATQRLEQLTSETQALVATFDQGLNEDMLQTWLRNLPKGRDNIPLAARFLNKVVAALSKHSMPASQMYQTLELLRPTLLRTVKTLTVYYLESEVELSTESEPLITASLSLLNGLTNTHTVVVSKSMDNKALMSQALHRALAQQLYLQVTYYQLHLAVPEAAWLKLHKLFQLSVKASVSSFTQPDSDLFTGKERSILQLYSIALLLGCSRVNHLTAKQILTVCQSLQEWVELVGISKQPESDSENQLVVDVTSGSAPHFSKLQNTDGKALYYLQVAKLIARLDEMLPDKEADESAKLVPGSSTGNAELLTHLKSAWSEYIYREARIETDEMVRACIGLEDIHFFLCGGQPLKEFVGAKVSLSIMYEEDEDISTIESQRSGDVWSAFISDPDGDLIEGDIPTEYNFQRHFSENPTAVNAAEQNIDVHMSDKSEHGCCLEWPLVQGKRLEVGELIGIKSQDHKHWHIGEVMWLDHGEEQTRSGIRLISAEAFPIAVDLPLRLGLGENYGLGILLPREQVLGCEAGVLLQPVGFEKNEFLEISQKGVEEKIKLGDTVKKQGSYARYQCSFLLAPDSPGL